MIETFENKETLDDILGFFDTEEIKNKEQTSTELSFLKARAGLAVEKRYGLRGEAKRKLAEKVNLSFNSLNQYATVANRIPVELQDNRLPFWLYRQASLTGAPHSACKVIKWALDTYGTGTFTASQYSAKCEALKGLVRDDASDDRLDAVINNHIPENKKQDSLHHEYISFPLVFTQPSQMEDAFTQMYAQLLDKWAELYLQGETSVNLRLKLSADFWRNE